MKSSPCLSVDTLVRQGTRHVFADMGGETALMSIENGKYYCLNETSSCIWALVDRPRPVSDICIALQNEFDVSPTECETAVLAHLAELVAQNLVDIVDAKAA